MTQMTQHDSDVLHAWCLVVHVTGGGCGDDGKLNATRTHLPCLGGAKLNKSLIIN